MRISDWSSDVFSSDLLVELVSRADANDLSHLNFAQMLAEHEIAERTRSRIERHRRQAGLPLEKHLEDFDYRHQTTITKRQVNALLDFGLDRKSTRLNSSH